MARISRLNCLNEREKQGVYRLLIPNKILKLFEIDPESGKNKQKEQVVCYECPEGSAEAGIEIKARPSDQDPIFYIEVSDSRDLIQLQWDFILINDIRAPRFNTDVTQEGKDRWFYWDTRNLPEEIRAVEAGLAPGQTRPGLRLIDELNQCLDQFCLTLGLKSIFMEALFYHNAIAYERNGFRYFQGEKIMKMIDKEFQPGGRIYKLLDDSPFRRRSFYNSVRGRSWAIHDGILKELDDPEIDNWTPPKMYRMTGEYFNIHTCSGVGW